MLTPADDTVLFEAALPVGFDGVLLIFPRFNEDGQYSLPKELHELVKSCGHKLRLKEITEDIPEEPLETQEGNVDVDYNVAVVVVGNTVPIYANPCDSISELWGHEDVLASVVRPDGKLQTIIAQEEDIIWQNDYCCLYSDKYLRKIGSAYLKTSSGSIAEVSRSTIHLIGRRAKDQNKLDKMKNIDFRFDNGKLVCIFAHKKIGGDLMARCLTTTEWDVIDALLEKDQDLTVMELSPMSLMTTGLRAEGYLSEDFSNFEIRFRGKKIELNGRNLDEQGDGEVIMTVFRDVISDTEEYEEDSDTMWDEHFGDLFGGGNSFCFDLCFSPTENEQGVLRREELVTCIRIMNPTIHAIVRNVRRKPEQEPASALAELIITAADELGLNPELVARYIVALHAKI